MSLKIVVLAKQVPDTRNVGKDAMTEEGTVNRAALPAIFNPEDLNALEMALHIKDTVPQTACANSLVTSGKVFLKFVNALPCLSYMSVLMKLSSIERLQPFSIV